MLPCPVKEWHKTTFTTADDTVTIEASKLTDRMTLELDQDGEAIIMADGKTRLKRIEPPDLGGVNPTDPTRYELPGRISVSIDGWTPVPGLGLFFKHSDGGTVVFIPTQQDQIGAKMIELGKLYGRLYQFSKMDTDQQIGDFQGRVFESEVKRMSDGVAQARLIAIEACCGEAVIVYAAATSANDPRSMWQNVDRMMASMRESTLSVDAGCAAPTARMKQEMTTLTEGSAVGTAFLLLNAELEASIMISCFLGLAIGTAIPVGIGESKAMVGSSSRSTAP